MGGSRCIRVAIALLVAILAPVAPSEADATRCSVGVSGPALSMTGPTGNAIAGEPVSFRWKLSDDTAPHDGAVRYLVLGLPEATRFEGRGFYALAPGARGPHDIAFANGRMRAVVALDGDFPASDGEIRVLFYRAGPVEIRWALVSVSPCGQTLSDEGGQRLEVLPGRPRLVGRDPFAVRQPDATILPAAGPFLAHVQGEAVEVLDRASGEVVLQATGQDPVFSPTGRFLVLHSGETQFADVYDLVAERRLGRFQNIAMYWSHADSFLFIDREYEGEMRLVRTLHGRRSDPDDLADTPPVDGTVDPPGDSPEPLGFRGPDLDGEDIDPGEGGGSFTAGTEAWSLDLSLEGGQVAFLATNPFWQNHDAEPLPARIIDLGLRHPHIELPGREALVERLRRDLGGREISLDGWNAGEPLWSTNALHEGDGYGESEEDADAGQPEADPDDAAVWMPSLDLRHDPTQTVIPGGRRQAAVSEPGSSVLRGVTPLAPSLRPYGDAAADLLDLAPLRRLQPLRSGRDDRQLARIAAELDALYDDRIARFPEAGTPEWLGYGTRPFPEPAPAALPEEPDIVDLMDAGRDTWRWTIGAERFWLTQSVEAGRLAHAFHFTLLAQSGTMVRRADLLAGIDSEPGSEGLRALLHNGDVRDSPGAAFGAPGFAAIAAERYLLVATRPVVRFIAFDLVRWRPACAISFPRNDANVEHLAMTADGRHLIQVNGDGHVEVYACANGAPVLSGLIVDDELILIDRNGYFDGSEDAAAYVELKITGLPGRHLLSQFASRLRQPGLARAALRGEAGRPAVTLAPPALAVTRAGAGFTIVAHASAGLDTLDIHAGGRLARRIALEGRSVTLTLDAAELPAASFLTLVAVDRAGVTSAPAEIMLPEARAAGGRLVGLAVGVDDYPGLPGGQLHFAAADALRLGTAATASPLYQTSDMVTLIDGVATAEAILARLDAMIAAAGEEDTLLFAFAGHGVIGRDGRLYLALSATDSRDIDATSLAFDLVARRLRSARARVVVLLDACHSGLSGAAEAASNEDVVDGLVTESGAGIVILSASKRRQFSEELPALGGGRFSVAVAEALTDGRPSVDLDGNGAVSLLELYRAVKIRVALGSQGRQVPWIARSQVQGDFDLF